MEQRNILESYKQRIQLAESVYKKNFGTDMDSHRKTVIAKVLDNTEKFLNEALSTSSATQMADMKAYKKFCINLTNVALPTLIANDLVLVQPLASRSGYVTYLNYTAKTTKGATTNGDVFNNPFALGTFDSDGNRKAFDADFTGERVVETVATVPSAAYLPAWSPVVKESFTDASGNKKDVKIIASDSTVTYANLDSEGKVPVSALSANCRVVYVYDNVIVPQNDIPRLGAEMKDISLIAKAYFINRSLVA